MTALQTLSSASALDRPISSPSRRPPLRIVRPTVRHVTTPLTLDQQGVRGDWFTRGIDESNCALFHASLHPIMRQLRVRIQEWLKANSAEPPMADDPVVVGNFVVDLVALAFEKRHQWKTNQSVLDWLAGFLPVAYAESDPPAPGKR